MAVLPYYETRTRAMVTLERANRDLHEYAATGKANPKAVEVRQRLLDTMREMVEDSDDFVAALQSEILQLRREVERLQSPEPVKVFTAADGVQIASIMLMDAQGMDTVWSAHKERERAKHEQRTRLKWGNLY